MILAIRRLFLFSAFCLLAMAGTLGAHWNIRVDKKALKDRLSTSDRYEDLRKILKTLDDNHALKKLFPAMKDVPDNTKITGNQILGIDDNTLEDHVKSKLKRFQLTLHPDRLGDKSDEDKKRYEVAFIAVTAAKENRDKMKELLGSVLFDYQGETYEIPHIDDIKDYFVKDEQKELFEKREEIFSQWKRFYLAKFGSAAALYAAIYYFKNNSNDRIKALKERFEKFEKEHSSISNGLKTTGKLSLSLMFGVFPIYYLRNTFKLANVDEHYKSVADKEGKVKAYYQEFKSREFRIDPADGRRKEYEVVTFHFPHGYMKTNEVHDKFMPLRKAQMMAMFSAAASAFGAALPWLL